MSIEQLKSIKEYQYLKKNVIMLTAIIVVWLLGIVLGTIYLWTDPRLIKGAVVVVVVSTSILLFMFGPFAVFYSVKLLKIKKQMSNYKIVQAKVASSYLSSVGQILRCSAYSHDNEDPVHFDIYVDMYDHGIEIKNGNDVLLWQNEATGKVMFEKKK